MTYPPRPTRRTNFRQAESAGLPVNTGDLDAEFNQLVSVLDQVVTRLTAISTSDGRLQGSAALTALALAGAQRFVATAGQTVFLTTIVWDSTMTSLGTPVMVNGVMRDPSAVTVANSGGFLQVTLTAGAVLSDIVVVMAYTAGAGIAARLADGSSPSNAANMVTVQDADSLFYATTVEGALRELRLVLNQFFSAFNTPSGTQRFTATAGQTIFTTTIAWDGSLSTRNVFVYQSGVLLLASAYSVSNATGFLRVTLGTGATLGELVEVDVYSLAAMWTGNGTDLAGRAAQSDFNLGTHKITNLAPGVLPTDAVNVQQLQALVSISDLLSIFIRKDGSVAFTANQSLGGHKLTSVADGTTATDGATFGQMQTADALALALNGTETSVPRGTLTGPVSYGQVASDVADADQTTTPASVVHPTIHGVPQPAADDQVANKKYVDTKIVSLRRLGITDGLVATDAASATSGANLVTFAMPVYFAAGLDIPLIAWDIMWPVSGTLPAQDFAFDAAPATLTFADYNFAIMNTGDGEWCEVKILAIYPVDANTLRVRCKCRYHDADIVAPTAAETVPNDDTYHTVIGRTGEWAIEVKMSATDVTLAGKTVRKYLLTWRVNGNEAAVTYSHAGYGSVVDGGQEVPGLSRTLAATLLYDAAVPR